MIWFTAMSAIFLTLYTVAMYWGGGLQRSEAYVMLVAAILIGGIAMILYRFNNLEEKIDALAEGQASKGAREQGWNATQAKGIHDQEEPKFAHYHRGGTLKPSFLANDCKFATTGDGLSCVWQDYDLSWGDNFGRKEAAARRFAKANH